MHTGDMEITRGLSPNTWYTLEMYVNNVTGKARVTCNAGTPNAEYNNVSATNYLRTQTAGLSKNCINLFETVTTRNGTYYIDNLELTSHHFDPIVFNTGTGALSDEASAGNWSKYLGGNSCSIVQDASNGTATLKNSGNSDANVGLQYTMYQDGIDDLLEYEGYKWTIEYSFLLTDLETQTFQTNMYTELDHPYADGDQNDKMMTGVTLAAASSWTGYDILCPNNGDDTTALCAQRWYRVACTVDPEKGELWAYVNGIPTKRAKKIQCNAIKHILFFSKCRGTDSSGGNTGPMIKNIRILGDCKIAFPKRR